MAVHTKGYSEEGISLFASAVLQIRTSGLQIAEQ